VPSLTKTVLISRESFEIARRISSVVHCKSVEMNVAKELIVIFTLIITANCHCLRQYAHSESTEVQDIAENVENVFIDFYQRSNYLKRSMIHSLAEILSAILINSEQLTLAKHLAKSQRIFEVVQDYMGEIDTFKM
jgi:virulence-associated protein VapD